MKNFLFLLLLLSPAAAQTITMPANPNVPYSQPKAPAPPVQTQPTPAQLKAAQEYYAPPKVVSSSMIMAVNLIINEKTDVTAMIGPLPRELQTALERAALHIPVYLAVGGGKNLNIKNARQFVSPNAAPNTIIATRKNIIVFSGGQLKIWESPFQADQFRSSMKPYFTQFTQN